MSTDPVDIFLWRALAIFLLIGALFGVALALLLIFKPHLLERVNRVANRWISMRHINRWVDISVSTEHWFYQYHRAAGIVIVLGASYILGYFSFQFDKAYTLQRWNGMLLTKLLDGLLDAMVLSALIGGVVALIAGLFLWLRPSLLRGMEEDANQWVSLRRATKVLDVPHHDQVDHFVVRHAQRAGWLLLLGSIYLFFAIFRLLA
jgi:hypothetical protein